MSKNRSLMTDSAGARHDDPPSIFEATGGPTMAKNGMQADFRRKAHGKKGEEGAATFLAKRGWTVIDRNVRFPVGEIDLVATQGQALWFFEVKTRGPESLIPAREAIQPRQLKRLRRAAEWYILQKGPAWEERPVSFGFLAVELDEGGAIRDIELIEETL